MATRTTPLIPIGTWEVDPAHSSVDFAVKHMGIANVRGKFTEFAGSLDMKEALANCSARGSITVSSIDTGDEGRDVHLRAGDFFDVEHHPLITFESTRVEAIDDESSRVYGNLTMHGVTMEIKLDVLIHGTDTDPWGNLRVGLEVLGVLMRSDFDLQFNQALGSGDSLVGDKVKMALEISAILQT